MATQIRARFPRGGAWGISSLGVGLAVAALAYGVHSVQSGQAMLYPTVETLLLLALAGTVAAAGGWLDHSDIDDHECWRIASWVGLGIILLLALSAWQLLTQVRGGATLRDPLLTLVVTETVGATLGLLVGVYHVRALRNARAAEQATAAADEARAAQDQLAFVHSLVRHHLRNGMQVIQSYTRRLEPHVDSAGEPHLETIQRRSERLVGLVENMQPLARTADGNSLSDIDAVETLRSEAEHFETTYPGTTVTVTAPETAVTVRADSLLAAVFENVLRSAIERSAVADPTVTVTVEATVDEFRVTLAAEGPAVDGGIDQRFLAATRPDGSREPADLHIARDLLARYDGSLTVDDGSAAPRFVVSLPAAAGDGIS